MRQFAGKHSTHAATGTPKQQTLRKSIKLKRKYYRDWPQGQDPGQLSLDRCRRLQGYVIDFLIPSVIGNKTWLMFFLFFSTTCTAMKRQVQAESSRYDRVPPRPGDTTPLARQAAFSGSAPAAPQARPAGVKPRDTSGSRRGSRRQRARPARSRSTRLRGARPELADINFVDSGSTTVLGRLEIMCTPFGLVRPRAASECRWPGPAAQHSQVVTQLATGNWADMEKCDHAWGTGGREAPRGKG